MKRGKIHKHGRFITIVENRAYLTIAPHFFGEALFARGLKAKFLEEGHDAGQGKEGRDIAQSSLGNDRFGFLFIVFDGEWRQVLPVEAEDDLPVGFSTDPLAELATPPQDGVLQKYRGRALTSV